MAGMRCPDDSSLRPGAEVRESDEPPRNKLLPDRQAQMRIRRGGVLPSYVSPKRQLGKGVHAPLSRFRNGA
jgi:hypothetical protein